MDSNDPVLIVGGHPQTTQVIRDGLREFGLRDIDLATDAQRALKRVAERSYALVIVDAHADGLSLIRALRCAREDAATRYIFACDKADAATVLAVKAACVSGFLLKPYSLARLRRVVTRALGEISHAA